MVKHSIPEAFLDSIAHRFRALGEPTRLRILKTLLEGEHTVSALVQSLGLTQSNTSRHLQALHDANLVNRRKSGLEVIYFVDDPLISQLCQIMCDSELRRLEDTLAAARRTSNS
ncbi:MAG: ArsR/SmtB family transcription factor [Acidobacteriota bacterium]